MNRHGNDRRSEQHDHPILQQSGQPRTAVIRPGSTVGLLGGGQLGRMIALAGRAMGYRFVTLDPTPDSPGGQVSDRQIVAPYHDVAAARELAQASDVITYEFENVDAEVARVLEAEAYVPQGSRLLRITQNRIREKTAVREMGIPVAPFRVVESLEGLRRAVAELGLPALMKTATGGYDGKGQQVLRTPDDLAPAYESLSRTGTELIVEAFVPFAKELSVVVARSSAGEVAVFPAAENIHVDNILHLSIVPARADEQVLARAEAIGRTIAEQLGVVGLIAVEMFLTADGDLYVNELAPRPHNTGHYTMDACATSQFEQHLRAVCGLPLGSTRLFTPVVMANILGEHLDRVLAKAAHLPAACKLHLYGKKESQPKRKMGHLNVLADSPDEALRVIAELDIWNRVEGQA